MAQVARTLRCRECGEPFEALVSGPGRLPQFCPKHLGKRGRHRKAERELALGSGSILKCQFCPTGRIRYGGAGPHPKRCTDCQRKYMANYMRTYRRRKAGKKA